MIQSKIVDWSRVGTFLLRVCEDDRGGFGNPFSCGRHVTGGDEHGACRPLTAVLVHTNAGTSYHPHLYLQIEQFKKCEKYNQYDLHSELA
jgi:hypothetical protein